jgi:Ca2+:H+ antiporter
MGFVSDIDRGERIALGVAIAATVVSFALRSIGANSLLLFVVSGIALAALAAVVGDATDHIGQRLGSGATGVLQSALGNLPELFISIFALRSGLIVVVQTALIGSILANSLLVLGLAFLAGGKRHGTQTFGTSQTRMMSMLLVLSVAALAIPSIAAAPGSADAAHGPALSMVVAVMLLVVFIASVPYSLKGGHGACAAEPDMERSWPMSAAAGVLVGSATAAAFVSDWFVEALRPAMSTLHISEAFVGLVIVAIAGNAVENVVGVQMAMRNKMDLAISLILNSSLQVALALIPALVIISHFMGGPPLTLVLSPLLLLSLALSAILGSLIVYDGESTWLEGLALMVLYGIVAASFWWGAPVSAH